MTLVELEKLCNVLYDNEVTKSNHSMIDTYFSYKMSDTEEVKKAIYRLKQQWKEELVRIKLEQLKRDFK